MKKIPIIIYMSCNNEDRAILHFSSISKAKDFLREQGVAFPNMLLYNLRETSQVFYCGPYTFEVQEEAR